MPLSMLSAIKEASKYDISVKGGKFLEATATADTVIFDKTGTLTHATPSVVDIITFGRFKRRGEFAHCGLPRRALPAFRCKCSS